MTETTPRQPSTATAEMSTATAVATAGSQLTSSEMLRTNLLLAGTAIVRVIREHGSRVAERV